MSAVFEPLDTRGTVDAVVRRIAAAIRSGELRAGERLPSERALAEQVCVSRSTVRKALRVLADRELIEIQPGNGARRGTIVRAEIVPADLTDGTPEIRLGEVAGVLEARRLFEPRVAQLAGFLMNDDDYQAMASVIELQRQAIDELHQVRELDPRFHLAIARATHNPTIVALMQTLLGRLELARYVVPIEGAADEAEATVDMHDRTLEAIASRDQGRIERTMHEHLRMMETAWEQASGRGLPRTAPDFLLTPPTTEA